MAEGGSKQKESPVVKFMPLILVATILVYASAAYLLLFMPKIGKFMEGGEYDVRPLEGRLTEGQEYLKQIEEAVADYETVNDAHKRKLDLILPPNEDVPGLFVQIDEVARRNGVVLSAIDTVSEDVPASISTRPIRIAANFVGGSYRDFLGLLSELESLVRVVDIQSISFTSGSGNYSIVMTAYYMEGNQQVDRAAIDIPPQPLMD
jgi:Tfp pilus assembly protein PilO